VAKSDANVIKLHNMVITL